MIPRGLARRYARALLNAAVKEGNLKDVYQDATAFRQVLTDNQKFKRFLKSPQTLMSDKKAILEATIGGGRPIECQLATMSDEAPDIVDFVPVETCRVQITVKDAQLIETFDGPRAGDSSDRVML